MEKIKELKKDILGINYHRYEISGAPSDDNPYSSFKQYFTNELRQKYAMCLFKASDGFINVYSSEELANKGLRRPASSCWTHFTRVTESGTSR